LRLAHYYRSIGYLRSLTIGAVRVDFDGASGTLTIKEWKSSMTLYLGRFAHVGELQRRRRHRLRHGWPPQPGASAPRAKRTVKIETEADVDVKVPRCSALSRPWPCKSSKSFTRKTT
jgi:hypothetical protein